MNVVRPPAKTTPRRKRGAHEPAMWILSAALFAVPALVLYMIPPARPVGVVALIGCSVVVQVGVIAEGVLVGMRSYNAKR